MMPILGLRSLWKMVDEKTKTYRKTSTVQAHQLPYDCSIETLEGIMKGKKGDYICTGIDDEQWVVRKDIFEKTYEEVEE